MLINILIGLLAGSIVTSILFFLYSKQLKEKLSSTTEELNKLKEQNDLLKVQSESYRTLAASILEKTYQDIPRYVNIKKDLAVSNVNVDDIASSLRDTNDKLVTHFSGILSNIDGIVKEVIRETSNAEHELLAFVTDGTKDNEFKALTDEGSILTNHQFLAFIQGKYNHLLQKIIDELVVTHERKSEDITTLDSIYHRVQGITAFSDAISEIAGGIELISLNANIEAAHAGSAGRGFVIVANEIRRLAGESEDAADKIRKEIKLTNAFIKEAIHTIKDAMDAESKYLNSTIAIIQDVFIAMTKTLFHLIFQLTGTLMNSMGNTSKIKGEIDMAINAMQFDTFIVQLTETITQSLKNASTNVDTLSKESINNLEKLNLFSAKDLAGFRETLSNIEKETKTSFQRGSQKQADADVTFF